MLKELSNCGDWKLYGSHSPKAVILGHSHSYSMFLSIKYNTDFSNKFAILTQANFDKHLPLNDAYWDFAVELSKKNKVIIFWNGNQHNINFLIETNSKFAAFGLNSNVEYPVVPISQIEALFSPTFIELESVLSKFSKKPNVIIAGTPAPKSKDFLDKRLAASISEPYIDQIKSDLNLKSDALKASSDELRSFMWQINQSLLKQVAIKTGLTYFPAPKESINSQGILAPHYYTDDLTHANQDYGDLILGKFENYLDGNNG